MAETWSRISAVSICKKGAQCLLKWWRKLYKRRWASDHGVQKEHCLSSKSEEASMVGIISGSMYLWQALFKLCRLVCKLCIWVSLGFNLINNSNSTNHWASNMRLARTHHMEPVACSNQYSCKLHVGWGTHFTYGNFIYIYILAHKDVRLHGYLDNSYTNIFV